VIEKSAGTKGRQKMSSTWSWDLSHDQDRVRAAVAIWVASMPATAILTVEKTIKRFDVS
jgi:hypothetical protein